MAHGAWRMSHGVCRMAYVAWRMSHGVCRMAYVAWRMSHGAGLYSSPMTHVDLLAIAAHRDDVELTCAGTLIKAARLGHRTAVLDLTQGEMGTRGSAAERAAEASRAAEVMGLTARENLGLPDAGIVNDPSTREQIARAIRRFRPRVVIAPAP